jgi:sensor histidine kinase YesM
MATNLPIRKILKIAALTIPFIAISGTIPGFIFGNFSLFSIASGFLLVLTVNVIAWSVNISLLYATLKWKFLKAVINRFFISCFVVSVFAIAVFFFVRSSIPISKFPVIPGAAIILSNRAVILPVTQAFSFNVLIFILIELVLLRELKNRISLENEQLKSANLEARINSLKEQLHPHFLFNSLSTLRSLINRSPEKASEYLEQLAELLRYSSNNSNAVILLKDEVTLTANYLTMQKVRFGGALNFEIDIPDQKQNTLKVPVYSLQQLAENAIKHNILTLQMPLHISIKYNGITNEIISRNNLQPKQKIEVSSGTGLANLNERYHLLGYGGIDIQQANEQFSVAIKLIPNESNYY